MLGRLNHVAIAVPDLAAGTAVYRSMLGAKVSDPQPEPAHGVTVVFVELPNTKVELLEPLGEKIMGTSHSVRGWVRLCVIAIVISSLIITI